jgi:hypothetical protein
MVAAGLAAAGHNPAAITPRYYKIPRTATEFVWVIAVTIPPTAKNPTEAYIALEMEPHSEPITEPRFREATSGNGAQFQIDYEEDDRTLRRLYVWRKK